MRNMINTIFMYCAALKLSQNNVTRKIIFEGTVSVYSNGDITSLFPVDYFYLVLHRWLPNLYSFSCDLWLIFWKITQNVKIQSFGIWSASGRCDYNICNRQIHLSRGNIWFSITIFFKAPWLLDGTKWVICYHVFSSSRDHAFIQHGDVV